MTGYTHPISGSKMAKVELRWRLGAGDALPIVGGFDMGEPTAPVLDPARRELRGSS
jgi:hypothetical protein